MLRRRRKDPCRRTGITCERGGTGPARAVTYEHMLTDKNGKTVTLGDVQESVLSLPGPTRQALHGRYTLMPEPPT